MITAYSLNVNLYEQYYLYPTVVFALHLHNNVCFIFNKYDVISSRYMPISYMYVSCDSENLTTWKAITLYII